MNNKLLAVSTALFLLVSATGCGNAGNNATGNTGGFAGGVGNAVGGVGNTAGNAVGWTGRTAGNVVGGVGNATGNAIGWAGRAAGNAVGGAGGAVGGAGTAAGNAVGDVGRGTGNAVGDVGRGIGNAVGDVGRGIGGLFGMGGNRAGNGNNGANANRNAGNGATAAAAIATTTFQFNNAKRIIDLRVDNVTTPGGNTGAGTRVDGRAAGDNTGRGAYTAGTHRAAGAGTTTGARTTNRNAANDAVGNNNTATLTVPVGWMVRLSTAANSGQSITILPHYYTNMGTNGDVVNGRRNTVGADTDGRVFGARAGATTDRSRTQTGRPDGYVGTPGAYGTGTVTTPPGTYTAGADGIVRDNRNTGNNANRAGGANGAASAAGAPAGPAAATISGAHTGTVVTAGGRRQATFTGSTPGLYAVVLGGTTNGHVIAYINVSNSLKTPSLVHFHNG